MRFEKEEFKFRSRVVTKSHLGGFIDHTAEDRAGVARKGLSIGREYIADEAGGGFFVFEPGNKRKRGRIGAQVHVTLGNAGKTFDGGTVEPDAVFERRRQLVRRDGDIFNNAHDIGKLQVNELDVILFSLCQYAGDRFGCVIHDDGSCMPNDLATERTEKKYHPLIIYSYSIEHMSAPTFLIPGDWHGLVNKQMHCYRNLRIKEL
jgi:hypothetical protein